MAEILDFLETGESCQLEIPGLSYPLTVPWVWLPGEEQDTRIASLNLIGKIKWNQDLGKLIARRIQETLPDLEGIRRLSLTWRESASSLLWRRPSSWPR